MFSYLMTEQAVMIGDKIGNEITKRGKKWSTRKGREMSEEGKKEEEKMPEEGKEEKYQS